MDSGSIASEKGTKSSIVQKGIWGDPWKKRRENEENLIAACSIGELSKVKELLDKSLQKEMTPSANCRGLDHWTPLHYATDLDCIDIMQILFENKALPDN